MPRVRTTRPTHQIRAAAANHAVVSASVDLMMECVEEELTSCQKKAYQKAQQQHSGVLKSIDDIQKRNPGVTIQFSSSYIGPETTKILKVITEPAANQPLSSVAQPAARGDSPDLIILDDEPVQVVGSRGRGSRQHRLAGQVTAGRGRRPAQGTGTPTQPPALAPVPTPTPIPRVPPMGQPVISPMPGMTRPPGLVSGQALPQPMLLAQSMVRAGNHAQLLVAQQENGQYQIIGPVQQMSGAPSGRGRPALNKGRQPGSGKPAVVPIQAAGLPPGLMAQVRPGLTGTIVPGTGGLGIKRLAGSAAMLAIRPPSTMKEVELVTKKQTRGPRGRKIVMEKPVTDAEDEGNWVPLDEYYYGKKEGDPVYREVKGEYRFKCWYCYKMLYNNLRIMVHMQGHIDSEKQQNLDLSDLTQCKHCYKQFDTPFEMQCHVEKVHQNRCNVLVCRICEKDMDTQGSLRQHMRQSHNSCEMPYICQLCNFRSSVYSDVVDHFKKRHDSSRNLLCLYCLRVFKTNFSKNGGWGLTQAFYQHVVKHQSKVNKVKCSCCKLTFISKSEMKVHRNKDHMPNYKGTMGGRSMGGMSSGSTINVDKEKVMIKIPESSGSGKGPPKSLNAPVANKTQDMRTVYFTGSVKRKHLCIECKVPMGAVDHFKKYIECSLCRYATACSHAYANHMTGLHSGQTAKLHNTPRERDLSQHMYCLCGYSCIRGNQIANHMVSCSKRTCYSEKPEVRYFEYDDEQEDFNPFEPYGEEPETPEAESPSPERDVPSLFGALGLVKKPQTPVGMVSRTGDSPLEMSTSDVVEGIIDDLLDNMFPGEVEAEAFVANLVDNVIDKFEDKVFTERKQVAKKSRKHHLLPDPKEANLPEKHKVSKKWEAVKIREGKTPNKYSIFLGGAASRQRNKENEYMKKNDPEPDPVSKQAPMNIAMDFLMAVDKQDGGANMEGTEGGEHMDDCPMEVHHETSNDKVDSSADQCATDITSSNQEESLQVTGSLASQDGDGERLFGEVELEEMDTECGAEQGSRVELVRQVGESKSEDDGDHAKSLESRAEYGMHQSEGKNVLAEDFEQVNQNNFDGAGDDPAEANNGDGKILTSSASNDEETDANSVSHLSSENQDDSGQGENDIWREVPEERHGVESRPEVKGQTEDGSEETSSIGGSLRGQSIGDEFEEGSSADQAEISERTLEGKQVPSNVLGMEKELDEAVGLQEGLTGTEEQQETALEEPDICTGEHQGMALEEPDICTGEQQETALEEPDICTGGHQGTSLEEPDICTGEHQGTALEEPDMGTGEHQLTALEEPDMGTGEHQGTALEEPDIGTVEHQGTALEEPDIGTGEHQGTALEEPDMGTGEHQGTALEEPDICTGEHQGTALEDPDMGTGEHQGPDLDEAPCTGEHQGPDLDEAPCTGEHQGPDLDEAPCTGEHQGPNLDEATGTGEHQGPDLDEATGTGEHQGPDLDEATGTGEHQETALEEPDVGTGEHQGTALEEPDVGTGEHQGTALEEPDVGTGEHQGTALVEPDICTGEHQGPALDEATGTGEHQWTALEEPSMGTGQHQGMTQEEPDICTVGHQGTAPEEGMEDTPGDPVEHQGIGTEEAVGDTAPHQTAGLEQGMEKALDGTVETPMVDHPQTGLEVAGRIQEASETQMELGQAGKNVEDKAEAEAVGLGPVDTCQSKAHEDKAPEETSRPVKPMERWRDNQQDQRQHDHDRDRRGQRDHHRSYDDHHSNDRRRDYNSNRDYHRSDDHYHGNHRDRDQDRDRDRDRDYHRRDHDRNRDRYGSDHGNRQGHDRDRDRGYRNDRRDSKSGYRSGYH